MINKVIQFNESHKWYGCLGVVTEARSDIDRYMIAVSIPEKGIAYIFAKLENLEIIGEAVLTPSAE